MEGDSAVPGMTRATKTDTKILRLTSPDYRGGWESWPSSLVGHDPPLGVGGEGNKSRC